MVSRKHSPSCSSILSHSSRMKWPHCLRLMSPSLASALHRPGVATITDGGLAFTQGLTLAHFRAQLEDLRERIAHVKLQLEHLRDTSAV